MSGERGLLHHHLPATVDQAAAAQATLDRARRFYHLGDLDVIDVEFETTPTRFWRIAFGTVKNLGVLTLISRGLIGPDDRSDVSVSRGTG